jgi:hypothetical protein
MSYTMPIRDIKTREIFQVDPTQSRAYLKTRDGYEVRIHPTTIRTMVPKNGRFQGHTVTGTREMERL